MIRKLILKLLKLDNIDSRITKLEEDNKLLNNKLNSSSRKILENENLHDRLDFLLKRIEDLVKVGVDVHHKTQCDNWAVVCIKGKPETLKFYDLSNSNIRDVQNFLRELKSHHNSTVIDSHPQISTMMHSELEE